MSNFAFTVYCTPAPQGSAKAFVVAGRARITSDNPRTYPYRHIVAQVAASELAKQDLPRPFAGRHVPLAVKLTFYFARPKSAPKKREHPAVKPDLDKLIRSTGDALKGILYDDDAQVVEWTARKAYGTPERVEIVAAL